MRWGNVLAWIAMPLATLVLILILVAGRAESYPGIKYQQGGLIYAAKRYIEAYEGPVELTGRYYSAGTMWLGHPEACTVPEAEFLFHSPSNIITGLPMPETEHKKLVKVWASMLPPNVGAWFTDHFWERDVTKVYTWWSISGAEMIRQGVPQCGQSLTQS